MTGHFEALSNFTVVVVLRCPAQVSLCFKSVPTRALTFRNWNPESMFCPEKLASSHQIRSEPLNVALCDFVDEIGSTERYKYVSTCTPC